MNKYGIQRNSGDDKGDRFVGIWFSIVAVVTVATLVGIIWLIAYVVPHIVHALDRIP